MNKPFDPSLHSSNDSIAREIGKKIFLRSPYFDDVVDNPNKYGIDLLLMKEGKIVGYAECEVKRVWKTDKFPFDTIQFPQRKAKFLNEKLITFFVMANNDLSRALVVKADDLKSSPVVEVPNVYMKKDEKFFQVPIEKVKFIDLRS